MLNEWRKEGKNWSIIAVAVAAWYGSRCLSYSCCGRCRLSLSSVDTIAPSVFAFAVLQYLIEMTRTQKRSSGQTEENSSLAWLPSLLFSHRNGLVRRTQSVLKKGVRTFCIDQLDESERSIKMPHVWKFWHIIFYDWTTWLANKYVGRIEGGFFIQFYRGPNWWIYYVAPLFTKGFVNEPSMTINFIVIFQKTLQYKQRGARLNSYHWRSNNRNKVRRFKATEQTTNNRTTIKQASSRGATTIENEQ